jgi:hypothetical protein
LRRLAANTRGGVLVDAEDAERDDGQRPNRQVRAIGEAEVFPDSGRQWTTRITEKYVRGPGTAGSIASRAADQRVVMRLRPARIVAVASV